VGATLFDYHKQWLQRRIFGHKEKLNGGERKLHKEVAS
jgi:hypothetical protein